MGGEGCPEIGGGGGGGEDLLKAGNIFILKPKLSSTFRSIFGEIHGEKEKRGYSSSVC